MKEKNQEFNTLDLEDIIKEFGGTPMKPEDMINTADLLEVSAAISGAKVKKPEPEEAAPAEEAEAPDVPETETPEESVETVETEEPEEPKEPTIRLGEISALSAELAEKAREEAQAEAEPETEPETAPEEETEPNAEAEPAEEDDDADVELPKLPPLVFKPKSRLQQLRSELVAGPEKRYYELTEQGVGKLQLAMLGCLAVILISGSAALMYSLGMVAQERHKLMVFGQILAMLIGGLLGSQQMLQGVGDLLRGRFTLNMLMALSFAACCADGVFCLMEERVPLCAAFTLQVLMSLWATYHKRTTEMGQMDSLRKAVRLDSVIQCPDYYDGRTGFLRGQGSVSDFMEHYDVPTLPEKRQNRYALICLLASVGVAVVAGMRFGVSMALQLLSATLLVSAPASIFVCLTRPGAVLERKLHSLGTVLCGWDGVMGLCARGVLPVRDRELFPAGAAKLNGVKFYGSRDPDEVIAYAASVISANGGTLAPVFSQLLKSRNGTEFVPENMQYYGNGGIGGEVCREPVLVGSLDFLKEIGVTVPEGTMVKQAVYVAIDGELSGLFAINYNRTKMASQGLGTLSGNRRVTPLLLARDFMIVPGFIKERFGISEKRIRFTDHGEREELAAREPDPNAPALALTTRDGLAPVAYALTGARALRTACDLGLAIHIAGGMLGIVIMLALAVLGAAHLLTPVHILLYQLVWMVPGILVTVWPRTI